MVVARELRSHGSLLYLVSFTKRNTCISLFEKHLVERDRETRNLCWGQVTKGGISYAGRVVGFRQK